mgnify:CR=1 FL=1
MQNLDFSTNWNHKLTCGIFSTLRMSGRFDLDQIVEVTLSNKLLGTATCIHKERIPITLLSDAQCYLDTGYGYDETVGILAKMYPTKNLKTDHIYYYLFKWNQVTGHRTLIVKERQLAMQF